MTIGIFLLRNNSDFPDANSAKNFCYAFQASTVQRGVNNVQIQLFDTCHTLCLNRIQKFLQAVFWDAADSSCTAAFLLCTQLCSGEHIQLIDLR